MCLERIVFPHAPRFEATAVLRPLPLTEKVTRVFLGVIASAASGLCMLGFVVTGHPLPLCGTLIFGVAAWLSFSSACDSRPSTIYRRSMPPATTTTVYVDRPVAVPVPVSPIPAPMPAPMPMSATTAHNIAHARRSLANETRRPVLPARPPVSPMPMSASSAQDISRVQRNMVAETHLPAAPAAPIILTTIDPSKVSDTGRAIIGARKNAPDSASHSAPAAVPVRTYAAAIPPTSPTIDPTKVSDTGRAIIGARNNAPHSASHSAPASAPPVATAPSVFQERAPVGRRPAPPVTNPEQEPAKETGSGSTARAVVGARKPK